MTRMLNMKISVYDVNGNVILQQAPLVEYSVTINEMRGFDPRRKELRATIGLDNVLNTTLQALLYSHPQKVSIEIVPESLWTFETCYLASWESMMQGDMFVGTCNWLYVNLDMPAAGPPPPARMTVQRVNWQQSGF